MKWTDSELSILQKYYGVKTVNELAELLPERSHESIQTKAKNLGLRSELYLSPHMRPAAAKAKTVQELWDKLIEFQEASRALSNRVDACMVSIKDDGPFAVAFLADAHIGPITCRYEELEDRIDLMAKTDHLYIVSCGDTIDNYLPTWHPGGMFGQIVPPALQKQLVEHQYGKLRGKWLAVIQGCHDEVSHETDDFDWTSYLAEHLECYNLGFGGTIDLENGAVRYRIMARHKYQFPSSMNATHTVKRMRERLGDFDVGVVAHHHQASIEQLACEDGKDRIFIRPGSFKGGDRYSRSIGFLDTGAYIPTVLFSPKQRRMTPFLHLEQAITVLNGL